VRVLTIKPGPVETAMTADMRRLPLAVGPKTVADDIYGALQSFRRDVIYTPKRWRWIMGAVRVIPERIVKRLSV